MDVRDLAPALREAEQLFVRPTLITLVFALATSALGQIPDLDNWQVHDSDRLQPPIVEPRGISVLPPPSDAVVLFDGTGISMWEHADGSEASWHVRDGYMEVRESAGPIRTKQSFGDIQLHIEWNAPNSGTGQNSGNSGVFFMGMYEVQILNSHDNPTYPDGQAAAIYGQYPPMVNASMPPGSWQSYDISFRRPHFDMDGHLTNPAVITIFHNGVLVHDQAVLTGPTSHNSRPPYKAHADRLPIMLQDHREPTRYRNIWVRQLD